MKPAMAATGGRGGGYAEVGRAVMATGNAVDAVIAACLRWPAALASSGALVAGGAGIGRVSCRFPARIPGNGLSRPRRALLISQHAAASAMATPCAATALSAVLSRWGSTGMSAVVAAVQKDGELPHEEALELLAASGAAGFVKGPWGLEATRTLGPVEGGLLTKRDLIEAKPDLGDAEACPDGWISTAPADQLARVRRGLSEEGRRFAAVAVDHQGAVAAITLDAGTWPDGASPATVLGVETNTLLLHASGAMARKVGRMLDLDCGAAAVTEGRPAALCGSAGSVAWALGRAPAAVTGAPGEESPEDLPGDLLLLLGGQEPRILGPDADLAS